MRTATAAPILLGTLVLAATAGAQVTTESQIQTRSETSRSGDSRFEATIRRDTVVPVVFNETIDAGRAKVGDRFSARVDGGRDLPKGARMNGRIDKISKQNGQTVLTMRFDEVRVNGDRYTIDALPVPLNADYLKTQPDGRIKASRNDRGRETKVLGGLLGGLVVGSIFGKAKEGALLGTILGAGAAVLDKESGREIAVKKGARYGAMFERDANLTFADRLPGEDPYDAIRNPGNRDDRDDRDRDRDREREDRDRQEERDRDAERRDRPRLFRGGKEVVFGDLRPVRRDGTLWLPVREAARVLDLTFLDESRKDEDGKVQSLYTLEGNQRVLELDEERSRVRLDGRRQDDVKLLRIGDALYLPVSAFSPLVQESLTSDESSDEDRA